MVTYPENDCAIVYKKVVSLLFKQRYVVISIEKEVISCMKYYLMIMNSWRKHI